MSCKCCEGLETGKSSGGAEGKNKGEETKREGDEGRRRGWVSEQKEARQTLDECVHWVRREGREGVILDITQHDLDLPFFLTPHKNPLFPLALYPTP